MAAPLVLGAAAAAQFAALHRRSPPDPDLAAHMAAVALRAAALQLGAVVLVLVLVAGTVGRGPGPGEIDPAPRPPWTAALRAWMAAVGWVLVAGLPVLAAVFLHAGLDLGDVARAEAGTAAVALALGVVASLLGATVPRPRARGAAAAACSVAALVGAGSIGESVVLGRDTSAATAEAPARGPAPAQPVRSRPGVTVAAGPRWGVSTPGAITPYVIDVKSTSPADFSGEVVLVPAPTPPPGSLGTPSNADSTADGPPRKTPAPTPVEVLALGQTEHTVVPKVLAEAAPGDYLTYRAPVTLAGGGAEKRLALLVVEAPYGYRAELRDGSGRAIAVSAPPPVPARASDPRYAVALLSTVPRADATLGWMGDFFGPRAGPDFTGPRAGVVTTLPSARDVPESALPLSGLHAVVVAGFDTAELSPGQLRALQDFVALGGSLVLGGGPAAEREVASLPPQLVPMRPSGTATASLARLADLVGGTTSSTATVATGEVRSGRPVLTTADGVPLVVLAHHGAGLVVQLAYDPLGEPFSSDPGLRDLAWQQGLGRALAPTRSGAGGVAPPDQLWAQVLVPPPWPRWPTWGLGVLAGYTVVVGAAGYRGLRRRGRAGPRRSALVPVAALVVVAPTLAAGMAREPAAGASVEVRTSAPGGAAMATSYRGLRFAGGGQPRVPVAGGAVPSSVFTVPAPMAPGTSVVSATGPGGGVVTAAGPPDLSMPAGRGEVRHVQESSLERRPGLEAHLRLAGAGPPERGGLRLLGTVTNRSKEPLRLLRAQLPEGALAHVARELRPGATIDVDAPVVWPSGINAGSGLRAPEADLVMFAAASRAFTRSGQVVLAGLVGSGPDRDRMEVQVQVVPLAATENLVAAIGESRLVARVRQPSGALVRVLDLGGVAGLGPVDLVFNAYQPAPEVFDWATGSWRAVPLPEGFERLVPLAASEVRDGLVRMRWADVGATGGAGYRLALRP